MARIYTRTGDGGETSFFGGGRAPKSSPRVDLYGEVDELNCWIGRAAAAAEHETAALQQADAAEQGFAAESPDPGISELLADLAAIQSRLFDLGALLADPERSRLAAAGEREEPALDPSDLERAIDRMEAELPRLRSFILPGGGLGGADLHLARAVCRRAERRAVAAAAETDIPPAAMVFLNRLGDYLFVAARRLNHLLGHPETVWSGRDGS